MKKWLPLVILPGGLVLVLVLFLYWKKHKSTSSTAPAVGVAPAAAAGGGSATAGLMQFFINGGGGGGGGTSGGGGSLTGLFTALSSLVTTVSGWFGGNSAPVVSAADMAPVAKLGDAKVMDNTGNWSAPSDAAWSPSNWSGAGGNVGTTQQPAMDNTGFGGDFPAYQDTLAEKEDMFLASGSDNYQSFSSDYSGFQSSGDWSTFGADAAANYSPDFASNLGGFGLASGSDYASPDGGGGGDSGDDGGGW